jgi:hypothetical protein
MAGVKTGLTPRPLVLHLRTDERHATVPAESAIVVVPPMTTLESDHYKGEFNHARYRNR